MSESRNGIVGKVSDRFHELCKKYGKQEVRERLLAQGASRTIVNYWINGERKVSSAEGIYLLCKAFPDVSADWLLGIQDVMSKDLDEKSIGKYTGLSAESIKTLHMLKNGKTINKDGEIINVNPNEEALIGLNALLEFTPYIETPEEEKEAAEADWYEMKPDAWSVFRGVYYLIYPQRLRISNNDEYNQYLVEKQIKEVIDAVRAIKNPEYGQDGILWRFRQMETVMNAQKEEIAEYQNLVEKYETQLNKVQPVLNKIADAYERAKKAKEQSKEN